MLWYETVVQNIYIYLFTTLEVRHMFFELTTLDFTLKRDYVSKSVWSSYVLQIL